MINGSPFPVCQSNRFCFLFDTPIPEVTEVRLLHGLIGKRTPPRFTQVQPGLFALSFETPPVLRMEYRFELLAADGSSTTIRDPLNPFHVEDPFGGKSVAFAEGYAQPIATLPAPPRWLGRLTELEIPAPGPGVWEAWLWTPAMLDDWDDAPLLIFLDGGDYLAYARMRDQLANLIATGRIAPCRALFIHPNDRFNEYSASEETATVLGSYLPAALLNELPVPKDAASRIGIGASLGAIALLHTHAANPGFFGGLILQSGSFFQPATDDMESRFPFFDRLTTFVRDLYTDRYQPHRIPLFMTCGIGGENITNNRIAAENLRQLGFPLQFIENADAHNWTGWRDCIGPALESFLARSGA